MFVKLTSPDGSMPIYVNPSQIVSVTPSSAAPNAGSTIITTANANGLHIIFVKEDANTVHTRCA